MAEQSNGRSFRALIALVATATVASLLLSVVSLIIAVEARDQGLPALAYDTPPSAVLHVKQCVDTVQNNAMLTQYDVEYVITLTNSGGRSVNLLHSALVTGAHKDVPWPVALTEGMTAGGTAIDKGQSTYISTPANLAAGLSKKMSVNGRLRLNAANASQQATASDVDAGGALQLTLAFSNGSRKVLSVPYTVQKDDAPEQAEPCVHNGDFRYHLDQE